MRGWAFEGRAGGVDALHCPTARRSLAEAQVAAGIVVVLKVLVHEALEVALVENDHVVGELAA